jgi:hypothetical protein
MRRAASRELLQIERAFEAHAVMLTVLRRADAFAVSAAVKRFSRAHVWRIRFSGRFSLHESTTFSQEMNYDSFVTPSLARLG